MAKKEEWQKKSEASPHPGLESLCRDTKLFTWGTWQNVSQNLSTKPDRAAKPRKKKTKRKASIPPSAQRMLTTHASKKGSLQDGFIRFQTRWLFCCCQSGKFLPTSAEELRCRLTTRIFTFAPFIVPHRLTAADGATVKMPAYHTHTQTHPLWGPADFFLPKLGAGTNSHSGSNTGGTGQSLGERQQKEKTSRDAQHRIKWWKWIFFLRSSNQKVPLKSNSSLPDKHVKSLLW